MRPGLVGTAYRLFTGTRVVQWAAFRDGQLLGVLAWQASSSHADHLWLAAPAQGEETAIRALLGHVQPPSSSQRPLALDYPADRGVQAFESVGYYPYQTLIWMQMKL